MTNGVKPIPEGYSALTPYLCVRDAARAIEFYKEVFGATESMRMGEPGGKVGHAELKIGDAPFMLADEFPEMNFVSPLSLGGSPVTMMVYVEDVDRTASRAVAAGAKELKPVEDQFYGDRAGKFADPFGHVWMIATHTE
ncbi:MAG: VOC family protein, partial [Acidobacteria bacterium]|nr:VOC family protein [Acidobacteriota bacterium]